jgi:hypothetical protein
MSANNNAASNTGDTLQSQLDKIKATIEATIEMPFAGGTQSKNFELISSQ